MRGILLCLLLLFVGLLSAAEPALKLHASDGNTYQPFAPAETRPVLLFFISLDYPETAYFVPEINQIIADYSAKVAVYVVNSEASRSSSIDVRLKASLVHITVPVLLDRSVRLARQLQTNVRPEAVVAAPDGKTLLYKGRINDLDLSKRQQAATTRDLRNALDAILAGRPVAEPQPAAQGCKLIGIIRGESYPFAVQVLIAITFALFIGAPLTSFILGFRMKNRAATWVGWAMLVLGSLCVDMFIPILAFRCYDQTAPGELFPETPGTVPMVVLGWLPPLIFHFIGRSSRGVFELIRRFFAKRAPH